MEPRRSLVHFLCSVAARVPKHCKIHGFGGEGYDNFVVAYVSGPQLLSSNTLSLMLTNLGGLWKIKMIRILGFGSQGCDNFVAASVSRSLIP